MRCRGCIGAIRQLFTFGSGERSSDQYGLPIAGCAGSGACSPAPGLASETGANRQRQKAVMAGLKAALKAYRPRPYAGKLYILCSVERRKHLTNPATGWSSLAAEVEFVESGVSHEEVFIAAFPVVGAMIERILDAAQPAILAPIDRSAAE
jgi:hypothetical protein